MFVLAAIAFTSAAHFYLYKRVLPALFRSPCVAGVAALVFGSTLPLGMMGLLAMNLAPRSALAPLMICSFSWLGVLYFTLPLALVREVWRPTTASAWPLLAGLIIAALSALHATRAPALVERHIALKGWPSDGYRIVHLSDLHVGTSLRRSFVQALVTQSNEQHPNLVAITGDLVDGSPEDLLTELEPLRSLTATDGVWFALGNHEHLSRADRWVSAIEGLGVRVLRNAWTRVGPFDLVGIDDLSAAPDFELAFAGRDPERFSIALVHQPRASTEVEAHGGDLQLSGHTHGGQLAPLGFLEKWDQGCVVGVCRQGALTIHVTAGAGYWGPPMRFFSRAEVALLVLTAKS